MKIVTSRLDFSSQNSAQRMTQRIGQTRTAPTPALTADVAVSRRSLDSSRMSQQQNQSTLTDPAGAQTRQLQSASQQSGLRLFVESMAPAAPLQPGSGLGNQSYLLHETSESSHYQLQGTLALDDGRNVDFSVTGTLSRSLRIEEGSGVYAGKLQRKDPLILNLGADPAQLTSQAFAFDVDDDGSKEQVSFATGSSGFLFLDSNSNGALDDGSELFGARTGNGFAELAKYDEDGNGFIDSGDSIYKQLKMLSRNEKGDDAIASLSQQGIGALSLQAASTEFELTDDYQQSFGRLRATGVAIGENGAVMTLQQVDLTDRSTRNEAMFRKHFQAPPAPAGGGLNAAELTPAPIREALERLQEMTEKMQQSTLAMQQAMQEMQPSDKDEPPKSLMELLVERFFPVNDLASDSANGNSAGHADTTPAAPK